MYASCFCCCCSPHVEGVSSLLTVKSSISASSTLIAPSSSIHFLPWVGVAHAVDTVDRLCSPRCFSSIASFSRDEQLSEANRIRSYLALQISSSFVRLDIKLIASFSTLAGSSFQPSRTQPYVCYSWSKNKEAQHGSTPSAPAQT